MFKKLVTSAALLLTFGTGVFTGSLLSETVQAQNSNATEAEGTQDKCLTIIEENLGLDEDNLYRYSKGTLGDAWVICQLRGEQAGRNYLNLSE
jgi:hypothetical protein